MYNKANRMVNYFVDEVHRLGDSKVRFQLISTTSHKFADLLSG
jgi:hypothetical protein